MRQYVKTLGVTGRLAHTLVERHGKYTKARLEQDPYSCLHGMPGVTFRYAKLWQLHYSVQSLHIEETLSFHPAHPRMSTRRWHNE